MKLEKHKITLFTNADIEDIPEEIEKYLYRDMGAADLYGAYKKCRKPYGIKEYEITITVGAM